ncbi:MAG: hypothetical protein D6757_07480 [Alphaproteobacteria bacterium]|nr:MAG: hypothetical protein D6757_07480 [Alphaproteobacteria bacterium]
MSGASLKRDFSIALATRLALAMIHIATTAVIARLLTPAELGVYAVAIGLVMLVEAMRVFGVNSYVVRADTIDAPLVRSALGLSAVFSLALALAALALAEPAGAFYGSEGVARCIRILALNMAISPWPGLAQALLQRSRRFRALLHVQVWPALIGGAVSILLVLAGFSYEALAWSVLAQSLVMLAIAVTARPEAFVWRPRFGGFAPLLSFGAALTAANVANQIGARMDELVLGRVQGLAPAALYDKAGALSRLVWVYLFPALSQVLLPTFAQEIAAGEKAEDVYLRRLSIGAVLLWPLLAGLALFSWPLIAILYGTQWLAAAPVASVLAVATMFSGPFVIAQTLLVASGAPGRVLRLQSVFQIARVALLLLLAPYGLLPVAGGMLVSSVFYAGLSQHHARSELGLRWRAIGRALAPSLAVSLISALAGGVVVAIFGWKPVTSPLLVVVLAMPVMALAWYGAVIRLRHPLADHLPRPRRPDPPLP